MEAEAYLTRVFNLAHVLVGPKEGTIDCAPGGMGGSLERLVGIESTRKVLCCRQYFGWMIRRRYTAHRSRCWCTCSTMLHLLPPDRMTVCSQITACL